MGYDSDHPLAEGEVGKCGVAISSLADMEALFDQIPLADVTTSMTINSPRRGDLGHVSGGRGKAGRGLENDLRHAAKRHPQGIHRAEGIHLSARALDAAGDWTRSSSAPSTRRKLQHHLDQRLPHSRSGLDRDSGTGLHAARWNRIRGVGHCAAAWSVDDFAPRLSFFFNAHNDFFEEIAKYRAARRIWHKAMRERFGAKNPRTWALRFHAQTAGCSLTAQQPHNNVVRTALQALAAVLGGTQSLHTNSLDEAWALPTEFAATLALRTQQIIAHETASRTPWTRSAARTFRWRR
jgi:methylmalonyl-CoA mutase N-terminal domain/subunit